MTQPYTPPVTGLSVAGGNLVATLADGTTSTMALPVSTAAAATSASTMVSASTVTTSYARPLSDFTGEIVHVVSFIPVGTAISAVSDWGPIWNAALAECRAIVGAGRQFHLIGPGCSQVVSTTINMTDLGWGESGGTPFGSQIDFNNATIFGKTDGSAVIDAMNTWFLRISNLTLNGVYSSGSTPSMPTIGFQHGRVITASNADTLQFSNCFFTGYYSFTGYYNLASESLSFLSSWLSNSCPLSQATGVVSVGGPSGGAAPTPVSGAAKVCYVAVLDGLNHWQVPTLSTYASTSKQTPFPPETLVSFEQSTFLNVTFSGNGPALWMSHCASPRFIRCYANSGSGTSMVDIYRIQNDDFDDAEFDIHFESFGSTPPVCTFQLLGPAYTFNFPDGFLFRDSGTYATTSVFKLAGSQASPNVVFQDIDIKILVVNNPSTGAVNTTPLFDKPASYASNGNITCPAGVYNGVNHSGRLNLDGAISEVGKVLFGGQIASSTMTAALAEVGINVVGDSVQSTTVTAAGGYYDADQSGAVAYSVTVTFPTPPGGTAATGTPVLGCNGLGLKAAGTGYTSANNLVAKDVNGNTLPFSVSIIANSGGLGAVYFNQPTTPFNTISAGPYTVVQTGASGGTFYANFSVIGVTMLTGGSGYQNYSGVVTPTFSPAGAAATANMAASLNSFNVAAGQKIGLDTAGTNWIEEDANGLVVIGTGTTRLMSINPATGNVLVKGTITASTTV